MTKRKKEKKTYQKRLNCKAPGRPGGRKKRTKADTDYYLETHAGEERFVSVLHF